MNSLHFSEVRSVEPSSMISICFSIDFPPPYQFCPANPFKDKGDGVFFVIGGNNDGELFHIRRGLVVDYDEPGGEAALLFH